MCTTACSDSLAQYVRDVNIACNQTGEPVNAAISNADIRQEPVANVGEVDAMNGCVKCYICAQNNIKISCQAFFALRPTTAA